MSLLANFSDDLTGQQRLRVERRVCGRCRAQPPVAVLRAGAVCGACVERAVYAKARSALSRSAAAGARVATTFSGGQAGRALLDVVLRAMHVGRKRRVCADAAALVVDASDVVAALRGSVESGGGAGCWDTAARRAARRRVVVEALRCGFSVIYTPLCAVFAESPLLACAGAPAWLPGTHEPPPPPVGRPAPDGDAAVEAAADAAMCAIEALRSSPEFACAAGRTDAFFCALRTADARADALDCLTRRAGVEAAAAAGVAALLVSDTADEAARRALCALAAGRGAGISLDAAPADDRHVGGVGGRHRAREGRARCKGVTLPVPPCAWARDPASTIDDPWLAPTPLGVVAGPAIVRPLLEVEAAEVALYCRLRRLAHDGGAPGLGAPPLLVPLGGTGSSIASVTDALLAGLQRGFANTVHNVVRTARKLRLADDDEREAAADGNANGRRAAAGHDLSLCHFCHAVVPHIAAPRPPLVAPDSACLGEEAVLPSTAAALADAHAAGDPDLCRGCRLLLVPSGSSAPAGSTR